MRNPAPPSGSVTAQAGCSAPGPARQALVMSSLTLVILAAPLAANDVAAGPPQRPLRVDPAIEQQQADRLAKLRAERDQQAVDAALAELRKAAEGTDNVLYPMKEALRARATVGEVCNTLRETWGAYVPSDVF